MLVAAVPLKVTVRPALAKLVPVMVTRVPTGPVVGVKLVTVVVAACAVGVLLVATAVTTPMTSATIKTVMIPMTRVVLFLLKPFILTDPLDALSPMTLL